MKNIFSIYNSYKTYDKNKLSPNRYMFYKHKIYTSNLIYKTTLYVLYDFVDNKSYKINNTNVNTIYDVTELMLALTPQYDIFYCFSLYENNSNESLTTIFIPIERAYYCCDIDNITSPIFKDYNIDINKMIINGNKFKEICRAHMLLNEL